MYLSMSIRNIIISFILIINVSHVFSRKTKTEFSTPTTTQLSSTVTIPLEEFEGKKSVLFLCRDNYMRSPVLKSIFLDLLEKTNETHNWIVDSASIGWWDEGKGMDSRAEHWCKKYGYNTSHIVREISDDDFFKFQYIISTDEDDFRFSQMQKPQNGTAELVLLSKFNHIKKFTDQPYLKDPFFLKTKELKLAMDDIFNRGYWFLVGFLDIHGVKVPTTPTKPKPMSTTTKPKKNATTVRWEDMFKKKEKKKKGKKKKNPK